MWTQLSWSIFTIICRIVADDSPASLNSHCIMEQNCSSTEHKTITLVPTDNTCFVLCTLVSPAHRGSYWHYWIVVQCCIIHSIDRCVLSLVPMHPTIIWPLADLCSRSELWFKTSPSSQWLSVHQITTLAKLRGPTADIIRPGCLCPINFLPHSFTPFSACQCGQSGGDWKCLLT